MNAASPMAPYERFVRDLRGVVRRGPTASPADQRLARRYLDGEASLQLRALIPAPVLKTSGAFFSGSSLSAALAEPVLPQLSRRSVVYDPACGAGDLLLPFVHRLLETGAELNDAITGRDLHSEFISAARLRLRLAHLLAGADSDQELVFDGIRRRSTFNDRSAARRATHVMMNPPFVAVPAPPWVTWSAGSTNSAGIFVDWIVQNAVAGATVRSVLPDVLRSGARYKSWRSHIERLCDITSIEPFGRFDSKTDVDVFMATFVVGEGDGTALWTSGGDESVLGDIFDVSVGTVVNYRDPERGPLSSYLTAGDLRRGGTIRRVPRRRRFAGRMIEPPFVAIARTSSPHDNPRVRCAVVAGVRRVAVDNHIIVATPRHGALEPCEQLCASLEDARVTEWLNARIRCRHLTVGSIAEIPLEVASSVSSAARGRP